MKGKSTVKKLIVLHKKIINIGQETQCQLIAFPKSNNYQFLRQYSTTQWRTFPQKKKKRLI